jgi:adenylosuccinate synthase
MFSRDADAVVRYQGGSNGHTVSTSRNVHFHLVPPGFYMTHRVIGNGVVLTRSLIEEMDHLQGQGVYSEEPRYQPAGS